MKYIASCSFGKDSLAMVLMLIERGLPLDEVVFYDTGMEFQAIYDLRDDMLPIFQQHGIKYTTLYPDNPFLYDMLERPVKGRERRGYGWCGGLCRWGTTCKLRTIDQYAERQGAKVYVGIAADETPRLQKERKPYKLFPLAEFGMTEADCLQYCYSAGYFWLEGSIRLYDILDRVSCWCCCNKNLKELRNIRQYLPEYSGPYIITRQDNETGKVEGYNWERIPLVCFKSSHHEIPLLSKVKCLQDAYNNILSNFANQMEEDIHTTILVIKNYDGEDLGTFRRNLATYGAIKVRSYEGAEGGVDTLEISVNAENYKTLLALLKDAIIENARGYDAKDDRMSGDPNQMNIQSMYSDIDLDANGIEMEFQASMEELLWFINKHLANTGGRSFEGEDVTVIFDRDVLINETEAINNCKNSVGILSDETIVKMHPWVTDPEQELQRIKDEKEEAMQADPYQAAFLANRNQPPVNNEGGGDGKTD